MVGRHQEALDELSPLQPEVASLGFVPLRAELRLQRGLALVELGASEQGVPELFAALWDAESTRHDRVAWRAIRRLLTYEGGEAHQLEEARRSIPLGEAIAARMDDPRVGIELAETRGIVEVDGDRNAAEHWLVEALNRAESTRGTPPRLVERISGNLGALYLGELRFADAEPRFRRSLEIAERELGPHHPITASWMAHLGITLHRLGHHDEARTLLERAIAIHEETLAAGHPTLVNERSNLGTLEHESGDDEAAARQYARALEDLRAAGRDETFQAAGMLHNIAQLDLDRRDFDAASARDRHALEILARVGNPGHTFEVPALFALAEAARECGQTDAARRVLARLAGLETWTEVEPELLDEIALARAEIELGSGAAAGPPARCPAPERFDLGRHEAPTRGQ